MGQREKSAWYKHKVQALRNFTMFHGVARVNERKGGETRREEPWARRRGRGSFLRPTRKFLAFLITALAELITGKCNGNLGGRGERKRATRARRMRTRKRDRDSRAFQSTLPYLLLLSLPLSLSFSPTLILPWIEATIRQPTLFRFFLSRSSLHSLISPAHLFHFPKLTHRNIATRRKLHWFGERQVRYWISLSANLSQPDLSFGSAAPNCQIHPLF